MRESRENTGQVIKELVNFRVIFYSKFCTPFEFEWKKWESADEQKKATLIATSANWELNDKKS